jgi:hypothetical protein
MRSKIILIMVGLLAALVLLASCAPAAASIPTQQAEAATAMPTRTPPVPGYLDATYVIDGQSIKLINGLSEMEAAPGSASKIVTRFFGNDASGDLNGDGKVDIAFLLTQTNGGSGTFFYVVVALQTDTGYLGTNAVFLGDRIAPQTTEIQGSTVIVNYADRNPGESFDVAPSLGVSKYLKVTNGQLVEGSAP